MKKMKLDPDALRVESFEAAGETAPTGTVRGFDGSSGPIGCQYQCVTGNFGCGTFSGCNTWERPDCGLAETDLSCP